MMKIEVMVLILMVLMTALIIDTDNGVDGITDDTIEDYGLDNGV